MVNGRFIVPGAAPVSNLAYTVRGRQRHQGLRHLGRRRVLRRRQHRLHRQRGQRRQGRPTRPRCAGDGPEPDADRRRGSPTALDARTPARRRSSPRASTTTRGTQQFTVSYNGAPRHLHAWRRRPSPTTARRRTRSRSTVRHRSDVHGHASAASRSRFDTGGNNPVDARVPLHERFLHRRDRRARRTTSTRRTTRSNAISYLPETTQYGVHRARTATRTSSTTTTCGVVFPVISGANVNAGVATVGADNFTVHIDEVDADRRRRRHPGQPELVRDQRQPVHDHRHADRRGLLVLLGGRRRGGAATVHSANTFKLTDPTVTYTLHLDAANLPSSITRDVPGQPEPGPDRRRRRRLRHHLRHGDDRLAARPGPGGDPDRQLRLHAHQPLRLDQGEVHLRRPRHLRRRARWSGQFTVYSRADVLRRSARPTRSTPVSARGHRRQASGRTRCMPNPTMFSINGPTTSSTPTGCRTPIVGNGNVSPLATDVTVAGGPAASQLDVHAGRAGLRYVEDALGTTCWRSPARRRYPIAQPALTFKLDSSLVFTLVDRAAGRRQLSRAPSSPIGTVTAGTHRAERLRRDAGVRRRRLLHLQEPAVHAGQVGRHLRRGAEVVHRLRRRSPAAGQQQLAVFDLGGTTYLVTDGTTPGDAAPRASTPGRCGPRPRSPPSRRSSASSTASPRRRRDRDVTAVGRGPLPVPGDRLERRRPRSTTSSTPPAATRTSSRSTSRSCCRPSPDRAVHFVASYR